MKFGINIDEIDEAVLGMTTVRRYFGPDISPTGIPPGFELPPHAGLTSIISAKPDLDLVVSGKADEEIANWLRSMAPGTYATFWHEANLPQRKLDPAKWREAISRLASIKMRIGAEVYVGYILDTWGISQGNERAPIDPWIVGHADWAGIDGYQLTGADTAKSLFEGMFSAISAAPGMPELLICETNTSGVTDAWLDEVVQFAIEGIATTGYSQTALDGVAWYSSLHGPSFAHGMPSSVALCKAARECTDAQ